MENFEDMFDEETLNEPVYTEDVDQYGESLSTALYDLRLMFARLRRQYQGDTWISLEVWNQYCLLDQAYERMLHLFDQGVFDRPKDHTAPGQST